MIKLYMELDKGLTGFKIKKNFKRTEWEELNDRDKEQIKRYLTILTKVICKN